MRLASLGSGSKGNATLVRGREGCLLIDCGFSLKQFEQRLARLDVAAAEIRAILVTHEHSDHGSGVARVAARYDLPVLSTIGTARRLELERFEAIRGEDEFELAGLRVRAVTVPHDAAEPVQFVFEDSASGTRLGVLTDTGHVTDHMVEVYAELDALLLEFNYDGQMLENGPYPYHLKQRIAGRHGHLSNRQSLDLLQRIDRARLRRLIAAHLSEKNNAPAIVAGLLDDDALEAQGCRTHIACQQQGFGWIEI
jgi:phosphoribosyl 1,2-cyclic phosphodiesterase